MPGVHWVTAPTTALNRVVFMVVLQLSPNHSIHIVGHAALGVWQSPNNPTFSTWWGYSFPGSAPPNDMVDW